MKLVHGDCLEVMKEIPDNSIDLILTDLPYGQTARNNWDTVIPFDKLWESYNRIIKPKSVIILFANGLFTADLMSSNRNNWKYNLVWNKVLPSGFLNAKKMPLRNHEDICVFYKKPPTYNPQMTISENKSHSRGKAEGECQDDFSRNTNYGKLKAYTTKGNLKYPKSILEFSKPHPSTTIHPTQKPVPLLEYLIKTYTNEGETVLDNCAGSFSTGIACLNTNRDFIGIEKEESYFKLGVERMANHRKEINLDEVFP